MNGIDEDEDVEDYRCIDKDEEAEDYKFLVELIYDFCGKPVTSLLETIILYGDDYYDKKCIVKYMKTMVKMITREENTREWCELIFTTIKEMEKSCNVVRRG